MDELVTYTSLAFYVTRPKILLYQYGDAKFSATDTNYTQAIEQLIANHSNKIDAKGNRKPDMTRAEAVQQYVDQYIQTMLAKGDKDIYDDSLVDLHYAASLGEEYYSKITASLGPVFDKINKTSAKDIFSWEGDTELPVISSKTLFKRNKSCTWG